MGILSFDVRNWCLRGEQPTLGGFALPRLHVGFFALILHI